MNKNKKIISLSLAKELQQVAKKKDFELPESEKVYLDNSEDIFGVGVKEDYVLLEEKELKNIEYPDYIPAFDTSELGEILPRNIKIECGISTIKEWRIVFFEKNLDEKSKNFMGEKTIKITDGLTEAEARGKMFIYLIKNNLLKN